MLSDVPARVPGTKIEPRVPRFYASLCDIPTPEAEPIMYCKTLTSASGELCEVSAAGTSLAIERVVFVNVARPPGRRFRHGRHLTERRQQDAAGKTAYGQAVEKDPDLAVVLGARNADLKPATEFPALSFEGKRRVRRGLVLIDFSHAELD
jgi:hypothetical protein